LAITCDNASNMDSMLSNISYNLNDLNISFETHNQHVRCLAHIINLAAKNALEGLNASGLDVDENIIDEREETNENLKNTIYKVILKFV
jgi:hypothetical protein